jgi:hypothetical protein
MAKDLRQPKYKPRVVASKKLKQLLQPKHKKKDREE